MTILVFDSSAGKILNLHGLSHGAFLLRNAKQGTFRKIGGPRNTSRMTNYANVLAILSSVFEFVQEGNRFVNKLLDLICALELTELCLAKSCFISLIHMSKRI